MSGFWHDLKSALWPAGDLGQKALTTILGIVVPTVGAYVAVRASLSLASAVAVLSPLAIIAAGQLTSFVYLANLRMKFSERTSLRQTSEESDRKMIDTAVAGVLFGAIVSATTALILSVLAMTTTGEDGSLKGVAAVLVLSLTVFSFGVFVSNVPNLWAAYSQAVKAEAHHSSAGSHSI